MRFNGEQVQFPDHTPGNVLTARREATQRARKLTISMEKASKKVWQAIEKKTEFKTSIIVSPKTDTLLKALENKGRHR
jgi:hypothetical protein